MINRLARLFSLLTPFVILVFLVILAMFLIQAAPSLGLKIIIFIVFWVSSRKFLLRLAFQLRTLSHRLNPQSNPIRDLSTRLMQGLTIVDRKKNVSLPSLSKPLEGVYYRQLEDSLTSDTSAGDLDAAKKFALEILILVYQTIIIPIEDAFPAEKYAQRTKRNDREIRRLLRKYEQDLYSIWARKVERFNADLLEIFPAVALEVIQETNPLNWLISKSILTEEDLSSDIAKQMFGELLEEFKEDEIRQAQVIHALILSMFNGCIRSFPLGRRWLNVELAIRLHRK